MNTSELLMTDPRTEAGAAYWRDRQAHEQAMIDMHDPAALRERGLCRIDDVEAAFDKILAGIRKYGAGDWERAVMLAKLDVLDALRGAPADDEVGNPAELTRLNGDPALPF